MLQTWRQLSLPNYQQYIYEYFNNFCRSVWQFKHFRHFCNLFIAVFKKKFLRKFAFFFQFQCLTLDSALDKW